MESMWTNECVIKRDLYKAQGYIPGDISHTITPAAKPPNRIIIKENEGEPFDCCLGAEFQSGPDIQLIQHMLHVVKETNTHQDIICDSVKVIEIEKPYLLNNEPNLDNTVVDNVKLKVHKQKRQRNVAIASLLEILSKDNATSNNHGSEVECECPYQKHLKLLKPEDFILKTKSSYGKCNNMVVDICECMYNKRNEETESNSEIKMRDVNENLKTEPKSFGAYKPSSMADLYYKQFLERSKFKELMRDYYETNIEKTMKILDKPELEVVRLPQHRHLSTDDCSVCRVLYKKFVEEAMLIKKK